ncbi:MAG TPA: signal peptide peptidase SppA, partial [Planctomycetaceae bacterium]|nr:signal peptide peptidase SppA [Planctomycetaceae bacterium]
MQEQQALPENSREKADESRPAAPPARRWIMRSMVVLLMISVLFNLGFYAWYQEYFTIGGGPTEQFETGDQFAADKIAIISITGTIMPPFTERILESIKTADEDDRVKGVLLEIDSPGGLVADSHQIYHRLVELRQKKPIVVSMKRMAASGGYYVAMGAGEEGVIFAEPTTWTGSLGVIIPRFDLSGLAENLGVVSD